MVPDHSGERLLEEGKLGTHPSFGQVGYRSWVGLACHQRLQHRPARDAPLPCGDPGDDLLDQMRRYLGHASSGTGGTKAASLATERHQQLVLAGVTAQG